jgi:hypothetical protein
VNRNLMVVALLGFAACSSSPTDPPGAPTLLVINGTCDAEGCDSLAVGGGYFAGVAAELGFSIGSVVGDSACLVFPASERIYIEGDTVTAWTPSDLVQLVAVSSADTLIGGEYDLFVPDSAPGWRVRFPALPGEQAQPMATPCTPSPM